MAGSTSDAEAALDDPPRLSTGNHGLDHILGGGSATITGGGDNLTITYSSGGAGPGMAFHSQSGRLARFAGSHGDGQLVEYLTPAPAGTGRTVWLIGGGDDAKVVADQSR